MLYCAALQNVALVSDEQMELIDFEGLDPGSIKYLKECGERCDVLCHWIRRLLGYILRLQGSVFPKAMIFALPSGLCAVGLFCLFSWLGVGSSSHVKEVVKEVNQIWASFTFVLGVLIVFRTNQAYSRYWEGATLLLQVRAEWLNATSSLIAFCTSEDSLRDEKVRFQHQLVRLMSMLYCAALQNISLVSDEQMEIIDFEGLDPSSIQYLKDSGDRCDVLVHWISRLVVEGMATGVIPVPPPILTRVFQELSRGIVNAKDVQKIAEFPFPFAYSQMIVVMLVVQSCVTPMLGAVQGSNPVLAFVVTFVSVFVLWCMNYVAAELEQPFGEDFNDLPIPKMMAGMNERLEVLMQEQAQRPPFFEFHAGMHQLRLVNCKEEGYTSTKPFVEGFGKMRSFSFGSNRFLASEGSSAFDEPSATSGKVSPRLLPPVSPSSTSKRCSLQQLEEGGGSRELGVGALVFDADGGGGGSGGDGLMPSTPSIGDLQLALRLLSWQGLGRGADTGSDDAGGLGVRRPRARPRSAAFGADAAAAAVGAIAGEHLPAAAAGDADGVHHFDIGLIGPALLL
eukprot:CAMPEP_0177264800 /NCGR_PEP_ID=MMETSP0367-20130122/61755_1 /TAXON_ID=447022 ORGANISM="Scrippsiella hangoei-like, Strain SHHI-4" /NCGR_SAMPLE_ID=MMETSP0367 /ASSEMBLY_ACC=CAM_ASM_000362 /LENGTH=565 /DNA_ID=CAMNT_0018719949 /DNA_START=1 /DNA_END=1694 /DNA_ORIENTATION=+